MAAPPRNYGSPWILCPAPRPAATARVFFFHHVGSAPSYFLAFMRKLPAHIEGLAVSLPGRGARGKEQAIRDLHEIGRQVVDGILPLMQEKPFLLFGHSFGAGACYTIARELQKRKLTLPRALLLSSKPAPNYVYKDPIWKKTDEEIKGVLARYGGTPKEILDDKEMMALALPVCRADWQASEEIYVEPDAENAKINAPFYVMWSDGDLVEVLAGVENWKEFTTEGAIERQFIGDHFWLQKPEHQDAIIALMEQALVQT